MHKYKWFCVLFIGFQLFGCTATSIENSNEIYLSVFKENTILKQSSKTRLVFPLKSDDGGLPLISAQLADQNSRPCLFDTGSQPIFINNIYVSKLPKLRSAHVIGFGNDGIRSIPIVIVPKLTIGHCVLKNVPAMSADISHLNPTEPYMCILGCALFHDAAVTLNFQTKQLILQTPYMLSISKSANVIPFELSKGDSIKLPSIEVNCTVDGLSTKFLVDTGCARTILFEDVAKKLSVKRIPRQGHTLTLFGKSITKRLWVCKAKKLILNNSLTIDNPTFAIGEKDDNNEEIGGVLGIDILHHFQTTIDYPGHRLIFEALQK
jgi:predicted aspartyl protease